MLYAAFLLFAVRCDGSQKCPPTLSCAIGAYFCTSKVHVNGLLDLRDGRLIWSWHGDSVARDRHQLQCCSPTRKKARKPPTGPCETESDWDLSEAFSRAIDRQPKVGLLVVLSHIVTNVPTNTSSCQSYCNRIVPPRDAFFSVEQTCGRSRLQRRQLIESDC